MTSIEAQKKKRVSRAAPFDPANAHLYPAVQGCDEVGKGALSGPVVTCAVWFDPLQIPATLLGALDDSKRITSPRREVLAREIMKFARVALASSSASHIDRFGIRTVTLNAMYRAVDRLKVDAPVLIDGVDTVPGVNVPCQAIVKGDSKVPQISAASIVAKVCRDQIMQRLSLRYPSYCWDRNVGYGTAEHLAALQRFGPTRHHRHSFGGVVQGAAI